MIGKHINGKPNARNNCPTWGWQSLRPAGVCCTHKHGDVGSRGNNQTCELSNPNWMVSDPSNDSKKLRVPSPDPKGAPKALMVEILLTNTVRYEDHCPLGQQANFLGFGWCSRVSAMVHP